jgi:hypothetical protein
VKVTTLRHMDVPAAAGGERGAKVTPFDRVTVTRAATTSDRESESSLLTAALAKQPLQSTGDAAVIHGALCRWTPAYAGVTE